MPTQGFLNQLDTTTNKKILPEVADGIFLNDILLAYLKKNSLDRWSGTSIQHALLYNRLPGDFYPKGDAFNLTQPQIATGLTFFPRYAYEGVTLFLEDVEVENAGPEAVIKEAVMRLQAAALGMSERLAIAMYHHGQALPADNRANAIFGLAEALNDGVTAGWDGNAFPNYGTVPRAQVRVNGQAVGLGPLDARMAVTGDVAANVSGAITYPILEQTFNSVCIGPERPDLLVTTNLGMSYIKKKFQPQQRFDTDSKVGVGFRGLAFNGSEIMQSQYAPGAQGQNIPGVGNFLTATGETMWFLNTKYFKFWLANSAQYAFGFTGWKPAQDNTVLAGQYLYGGPGITCTMPRFSRYLFNITG